VLYGVEHGVGVGANLAWSSGPWAMPTRPCSTSTGRSPGPDVAIQYLQYALTFTAIGHHFRRKRATSRSRPRCHCLIREQGLAGNFLAMATCLQGWALVAQGQREAGLARCARAGRPPGLGQRSTAVASRYAGRACAYAGQVDEGYAR